MSDDKELVPQVIDTHQELVRHIEQGAAKMRALSVLTLLVAAFLAMAYVSQLLLPLTGTTSVTVNLSDPVNIVTELGVLALAIAWLYVGLRDYRFSSRMRREIFEARSKERQIQDRLA